MPPSTTLSRTGPVAAACTVAGLTVAWRFLTFTGFNNDHYVHLARAQQMLLGEWPVRDFVDPGMPLMYAVSAVARAAGGRALLAEFLVVTGAFAMGAAFTLAAVSRLSRSMIVALAVTVIEIVSSPRSYSYPKILLYALAAWAIVKVAERPTRTRFVLLGLLAGTAFLFRHDHGVYLGTGALTLAVVGGWPEGVRRLSSHAAALAAGACVLLAPWGLFVAYHVGLMAYFGSAIEFSRHEAAATVLRTLPRFDLLRSPFDPAQASALLFYVFHTLPVTCCVIAFRRARRGYEAWAGESAAVVGISAVALLANAAFLRDVLAVRLPDAVVPAAVLGAWLMGLTWRMPRPALRLPAVTAAAMILLLTAGCLASVVDLSEQLNRTGLLARRGALGERIHDLATRLRRPLPEGDHVPSRYSAALMPFFSYLDRCTSPDDRLLMTGLSPDVYVLAGRGFAGGNIGSSPGYYTSAADQRNAIDRMRTQSVPFVLLPLELEKNFFTETPLLATFVGERYRLLTHVEVGEQARIRLYVEKDRKPIGLDAVTGWPCFSDTSLNAASGPAAP